MVALVEAARLFLLAVFSIKAGESATGKQLLPQNPLDVLQWQAVLTNYDLTTIAIVVGVFVFLLLILIAVKKKRREYERIIYVPVTSQQPPKQ